MVTSLHMRGDWGNPGASKFICIIKFIIMVQSKIIYHQLTCHRNKTYAFARFLARIDVWASQFAGEVEIIKSCIISMSAVSCCDRILKGRPRPMPVAPTAHCSMLCWVLASSSLAWKWDPPIVVFLTSRRYLYLRDAIHSSVAKWDILICATSTE
jgi:hypothetical protein